MNIKEYITKKRFNFIDLAIIGFMTGLIQIILTYQTTTPTIIN